MSTSITPVPPSPPPSEASRLYMERLLSYKENVADLDRRDDTVAMVRLAFAIAFAGCFGLRFMGWSGGLAGAAICAVCFVVLTFHHSRMADALGRAKRLVNFYQAGLHRINGGWEGRGVAGERFVDPAHVYTGDLDIFGRGSLFELLCTARTLSGEDTLASMLSNPCDADTARRRQRAVMELSPRLDLREDLAMADESPQAIFRQRFLTALNDPTWVRFVTWEALDFPRSRRIARQDRRQVALRNQRNAIIAKQFHGLLPKVFKAELLQLAVYALATYPLTYDAITKMVTGKERAELSGPIGITKEIAKAANRGVWEYLGIIAMLSVYLGLFNLLPLPALDGGRAVFLSIETLIRKRVNPKVEAMVHTVGLVVLLGVLLVVSLKDFKGLFTKG